MTTKSAFFYSLKIKMYLIIDLEATCWEDRRKDINEIIEIGAILLNDDYKILGEFQAFVKPVRSPILSEFCKNLTSITQKDVDHAEAFPVILEKLVMWAEKIAVDKTENMIFCSWGHYDEKQLIKDCQFHKIRYPFSKHRSLKHEFAKRKNIKPMGMLRTLEFCGIELNGTHHRALDDVKNITKIFIKEWSDERVLTIPKT